MNRKKNILIKMLVVLIVIFLMMGIAALLLAGYRKREQKEKQKQEAIEKLERVPTVTPTPAVTVTPTPVPTATPTPTPVPTIVPAFLPDDYVGTWYATNDIVTMNIYALTEKSVSFSFAQANRNGTVVCEADVTAEVAGNAAQLSFTDSHGNKAGGSMTFSPEGLYVKITTTERAEGVSVCPNVNCVMSRERNFEYEETAPTPTPAPSEVSESLERDYFFPESNSRCLTDEEISKYSSAELELAKNEIYARHGRQFVTSYIAEYFNSKSWYQGTIAPETFDAQQDSIFNEYEVANIGKIAQWEEKKRSEGN
ncbi:MAG: YARHG domain-containing protein [Eubacteriales bacterium]|nr:YARHG domain-containing protein [Eubacteriales bacterium]